VKKVIDTDNYSLGKRYRNDWRRHYEALTINREALKEF
jgi:hypothetical protein